MSEQKSPSSPVRYQVYVRREGTEEWKQWPYSSYFEERANNCAGRLAVRNKGYEFTVQKVREL